MQFDIKKEIKQMLDSDSDKCDKFLILSAVRMKIKLKKERIWVH